MNCWPRRPRDDAAGLTRPDVDWITSWQRVARRIRVPLGFLTAALYLFELWRRAPQPAAVAWSLVLVLPGLWLRGYAAGYVKKNRELTMTGPYAHTRNPLYLGSMLIAAGFAVALLSWPVALAACLRVCAHLHSRHCLGGALPARHIPRIRRLLPPCAPLDSASDSGKPFPHWIDRQAVSPCRSTSGTASTMLQ